MSGGTLDADETLTLSGALSHTDDITIDVKAGEVLTYSGADWWVVSWSKDSHS